MKLLLIGQGYLGEAVTRVFREGGWDVAATSLSGANDTISCDVGNPADVSNLPEADFIVHCAASGRGGAEAYQQVYVNGCRNLTEKFPGVPLLFTSSTSVYAQTDGSVVTEESPAIPERETGRLLLEAENITTAAGGIVARLAGIYGPGRNQLLSLIDGTAKRVIRQGQVFSRIHVEDIANVLQASMAKPNPGGAYNVCDDEASPPQDVVEHGATLLGLPVPPAIPFEEAELSPMEVRQMFITHKELFYAQYATWSERKKTYVADFLAREYQVDREGARTALFGPEPGMDELHRPQMVEGPRPVRRSTAGPVVGPWGGRR
jgi:nucleoside-diphosphate-sugar epimerase